MVERIRSWRSIAALLLAVACLGACGNDGSSDSADRAEWYVAEDGGRRGPLTESELRDELVAGTVRRSDLVWREGMSEWAPADAVLHSTLGTSGADDAGLAFLDLCTAAETIPRTEMETLERYAEAAVPAPTDDAVASILRRRAALLERARTGLTEIGDLDLDYAQGEDLLLPHLASSRQLARLLAADARWRSKEGDTETAAADCAALGRLARQVASDDLAISSLVSISIMVMFIETAGTLDEQAGEHAGFREILAWMRGDDPFRIVEAIETEKTYAPPFAADQQAALMKQRNRCLDRMETIHARFGS